MRSEEFWSEEFCDSPVFRFFYGEEEGDLMQELRDCVNYEFGILNRKGAEPGMNHKNYVNLFLSLQTYEACKKEEPMFIKVLEQDLWTAVLVSEQEANAGEDIPHKLVLLCEEEEAFFFLGRWMASF